MKCPKCQHDNPDDAVFCNKCGNRVEVVCSECGRNNPPGSTFCNKCGHDLRKVRQAPRVDYSQPQSYTPKYLADKILTTRSSIEGERKLVTVLFADVANYTSISEKLDPEEVHQIMDGCFKILMDEIHKYEGTINQFTGDGVMGLFGAPVAHEDHAQRACHASLSIQKAIEGYGEKIKGQHGAEFKMRIGMNSGPVIVGSIGDDLRMDYTAVGDTTNLASRIQDMANPGSVLVSGHTHRLARDFFEFESLGKVEVKGKEEPQKAYQLIRPTQVETRIEAAAAKGLTRFVGREKEIVALREAFERAKSGSGQVIGIVGEAGVGKSRLLLELRKSLPGGEYSYLEHRCLHYGRAMPYLPIVEALKTYFDIEEEDREATIKKKIRNRLRELDEKLEFVPSALHEVLSLKVEDDRYLQLGPQERRERTFETIRDLLIRESHRIPLVLAFEDVHWIDKTSQEFLDYLIGFLPTARVLLILLYRPEYSHPWGSKSYYGKIGLDQLSANTSMELVQALLEGGDVAPEIAALVLGRAGGNPLFVEELTHSLVENGSIQRRDDLYVLTRHPSEIEVPDTIQGIIAARMDRIEDNLKRIMQVASVIGREFAYRILQAITGMSEDLKASLLNLQGLEFIYEKQLFPELEYIFKHALTQEVAYSSLLLKRRKEIHERIGQAIENLYSERLEEYYELLAYHYVRSEHKQKAVDYLGRANEKAARTNAMDEAKTYLDQAMALFDTLPNTEKNQERRISLLVNQRVVFNLLLQVREYYDLLKRYEHLLDTLSDTGLQGAFKGQIAFCEFASGLFDQAIRTSNEAIGLCEIAGKAEDLGEAYSWLLWSHVFKGDFKGVIALKKQVAGRMGDRFTSRSQVYTFITACYGYAYTGRWNEAMEEGERAVSIARESSDSSVISFATAFLAIPYTLRGDLDAAIELAQIGYEKAPTLADKVWSQGWLAYAWCLAGDADKGIAVMEQIVDIFRASHHLPSLMTFQNFLGEAYLVAAEYEKARRTVEEALELSEQCKAKFLLGRTRRLLGEILLKTNSGESASHFEKSISIFKEIEAENELALAYSGMGRYHKQQGNLEEARKYLTDALEIFERLGTLLEPDKVRKELAELPR